MIKLMKKTLTHKMVIGSIIIALLYQLIFTVVWISGYSSVPDNLDKLRITVINEDSYFTESLTAITNNLSFDIQYMDNMEEAKNQLINRETHMIMHIPEGFVNKIGQLNQVPEIKYIINDSNPTMVVSAMNRVTEAITAGLNKDISINMIEETLVNLQVPHEKAQVISNSLPSRVQADVSHINPTGNMAIQMIPLLLPLISFVSAMVFNMTLDRGITEVSDSHWGGFTISKIYQLIFSIVIPFITTIILFNMVDIHTSFVTVWLFQSLTMLVSMQFTHIAILLLGENGMIINLIFTVIQPIAVGFSIPLVSLNSFYAHFAKITPMFYAVTEIRNLIFGGTNHWDQVLALIFIGLLTFIIGAQIIAFKASISANRKKLALQEKL